MHKWLIHPIIALALTLCVVAYASAQAPPSEASSFQLESTLSSAQEVTPPLNSTVTGGEVTIELDAGLSEAQVTLTLEGDASTVTGAHLHCARPGVDGPIFLGLVDPGMCDAAQLAAGMLTCTLTNEDIVAEADCMGTVERPITNIAALFFAARDGLVYFNVHTVANPAGELRGQLVEADRTTTSEPPPTTPPPPTPPTPPPPQ